MTCFEHEGMRLFYREAGGGPLLLVLHGNTASSVCYVGEVEHFSRRFHVASPDFPGCGLSERIDVWPKNWWRSCADAAAALVRHLDCGPAVYVGTSGGGIASLLAAIHHPATVRAVVVDSSVGAWTPEDLEGLLAARGKLSLGQIAFWQNAHGDDWHRVVDADTEMIKLWRETGVDFYEGHLGEITCPVLLTYSKADEMLPRVDEFNRNAAKKIPDSRVYSVEEGAHPMMWSRAEDFRRAADEFLRGLC